jgi:hypothetical protein
MLFLTGLLFLGRFFWYYTVAEKAAHDGARFLATAGASEMKTYGGGSAAPIVEAAKSIVRAELADLPVTDAGAPSVSIHCYVTAWDECYGTAVPTKVLVRITMPMMDPFFDGFTAELSNGGLFYFTTQALTDYVGN